jgi:hypothetical protein
VKPAITKNHFPLPSLLRENQYTMLAIFRPQGTRILSNVDKKAVLPALFHASPTNDRRLKKKLERILRTDPRGKPRQPMTIMRVSTALMLLLSLPSAVVDATKRQAEGGGDHMRRDLKKGKRDRDDSDYYYGHGKREPTFHPSYADHDSSVAPNYSLQPSSSPAPSPLDSVFDSVTVPPHPSRPKRKEHYSKKKDKITSKKGKGKGGSGKGKGKGTMGKSKKGKSKGKGSSSCASPVAAAILASVDEVTTQNPDRCCMYSGPTAVYVTHALPGDTDSGFEEFWDQIYNEIDRASFPVYVCFVMTGVTSAVDSFEKLTKVMMEVNDVVSALDVVPAMMVADPTDSVELINQIRSISNDAALPSIGVFNAGYDNIIIESIVSGQGRLPFVGYLEDADYGTKAGRISLELLGGVPAKPLCFNARLGVVDSIGERCAAYYDEITDQPVDPAFGIGCSTETAAGEIFALLVEQDTNAVWSHVDCCAAVADAADMMRRMNRNIIVGCMDEDTSGGKIEFVTAQPIQLQGYSTSTWANFPVIQAREGNDGRAEQFFPSLQSLVNTAIFNIRIR